MWPPSRSAPAPACPTVPRSSRVSDELPGGAQTLVLATSLSPSRSSSPPPDKRRCSRPEPFAMPSRALRLDGDPGLESAPHPATPSGERELSPPPSRQRAPDSRLPEDSAYRATSSVRKPSLAPPELRRASPQIPL
ncbi:pollen-specific leucine-rich repeat extensin-like protein 4 [Iris pallida]|uniref:Pollen-specific leucine-rich repeat extensin-like protein 4 n=1 Tax=Iris pallida TaxID=29817 RepID=A0AAX6F8P8_IRIPA|nr:pollen-specific leucine-rich repeat extensin-like protein 4 [Iris pallida]